MRNVLLIRAAAMMAAAMTMAGSSAAQKATGAAYVNKAVVVRASASAFTNSATMGYLPYVTDASGDLGNSALFQTGGYVGIGTTTPAFNLNVVSQTDPAAVTVEGYGTVGVNFIGRRAEGTLASPLPLLSGDNIMAMQGRGYGATGFSSASRAYMKFFASENWSDAAQGTFITLATTGRGSTTETPRMLIDDLGNVGIGPGLITPALTPVTSPLMVNGVIQSTTGGIKFPDGSTQGTAAISGVVLSSPDSSITVGGTAIAPTVAANTSVVQKRVTGICGVGSAVTSVNADGSVGCGATSGGGAGGGSALIVKDANGNVLGTLLAITGPDVTIFSTTGYKVDLDVSGRFVASVNLVSNYTFAWTGANCTGTPGLGPYETALPVPNMSTKNVFYSPQANQLMVAVGTQGVAGLNSGTFSSYEAPPAVQANGYYASDAASTCTAVGTPTTLYGFVMESITPSTLGWSASGNPLAVAGPLQLP